MLRSHPNKELYMHLNNTFEIGKKKFSKVVNFTCINTTDLEKIIELSLKLHDIGKGMTYFQEYIEDIENGLKTPRHKNADEKNHGLISGVLSFAVAIKQLQRTELAFLVFIVVCRHHGHLKDIQDYRSEINEPGKKELLLKQFECLKVEKLQEVLEMLNYKNFYFNNFDKNEFEKTLNLLGSAITLKEVRRLLIKEGEEEGFLIINYIFSILIYADKLEAILHSNHVGFEEFIKDFFDRQVFNKNLVENYKMKNFFEDKNGINDFREKVYLDIVESVEKVNFDENPILSINLPTGAGKTLSVFKAALMIREKISKSENYIPRIIYALPFTTIIDQNYGIFEDVIGAQDSRFLIKHHYLSEKIFRYENSESDYEEKKYDYDISKHLIESWDSEVVVTTFFQLLHSLLSNENRSLKKIHNIVGSIIILDEVQNIKFEYWNLAKLLFERIAKKMKCVIIFMTATMPLIFSEEKNEIFELATNKKEYFKEMNRIKLDVSSLKNNKFTLDDITCFLYEDIILKKPKSVLIVLNTIKSSIYIYNKLQNLFKDFKDIEFFYLSTNIIPAERKKRIKEIKNNTKNKIIVSTQMIEAGVDIDVEIVYRDFGPMDSINQTAGRCNRNGKRSLGEVIIFKLIDTSENSNYQKEFSKYVYDEKLIQSTENILKKHAVIQESQLFDLSKKYYEELFKVGSTDRGEFFINSFNQLKYSSFNLQKDSFRIIDSAYKTVDVYIQIDQNAVEIWTKYLEIGKIKETFERKKAFAEIKADFLDYVISVPETIIKKQFETTDAPFELISQNRVCEIYDSKTGFKRETEKDYFF